MLNLSRPYHPIRLVVFMWLCFSCSAIRLSAALPIGRYHVKGVIVEAESGKNVPYATITTQGSKGVIKRLAGDVNGKFDFTLDSIGKYTVVVQSVGFELNKKEVNIDAKTTGVDLGIIKLLTANEKIREVEVVAQKPLVRTEVDKIIYSFEADPESKTTNALEMLRKIPLVTVDGEDNIQVKGSSNFKILLNGKNSSVLSQSRRILSICFVCRT
jgi:hypothetical protein